MLLENKKKGEYTPLTLFSQITHVQIMGLKECLNSSSSSNPWKCKAQKDNKGSIYNFFQAYFRITYMQARTTKVSRQQKSATQKHGGHHKIQSLLLLLINVWLCPSFPTPPPPPPKNKEGNELPGGPPNDNFLLDQVGNSKVGAEGRRSMGLFVGPKDWKTMQPDKLILGAIIDQSGQPN